ncbi:MAG TPA: arginine--tRNA ligase, partial [Thermodesulfobacteriaceae bacterium]|nr:arginine--tRNA ligase [Thermodesulfobacteriaceae bacterium]
MIVKKIREELLKHLPEDLPFKVEPPREEAFGDYATNAALVLAGRLKRPPRELADELAGKLSTRADLFSKVEVAGPGFINFFVAPGYWQSVVKEVLSRGE